MLHLPINHRLQGAYRGLAAFTGLAMVAWGIVGALAGQDHPATGRSDLTVWGMHTNLTLSLATLGLGALVLLGALIGRTVGFVANGLAAVLTLLAGLAALTLAHTDFNVINGQVDTAIGLFIVGSVLLAAATYTRSGSRSQARAEEDFRHGEGAVQAQTASNPA